MIINKILNNNVIVSIDSKGREVVAMGRGIAFKKRVGDSVADRLIDKKYVLRNSELRERFEDLAAEISLECLTVSNNIIDLAEKKLDCKLNENIYLTLTDHINMVIYRVKHNHPIRNMVLWEIKSYYPEEYAVALEGMNLLNELTGTNLPEDEAGFITMHLVDARMSNSDFSANKIITFVSEIVNISRLVCNIDFDRNSMVYYRFITHLKYFATRILSKTNIAFDVDDDMLEMVTSKYPVSEKCVASISIYLKKEYSYNITASEKLYLMLHISRLVAYATGHSKT